MGNGNLGLGSPSYKWSTVYAVTGTISTSDRNEKHYITDLYELGLSSLDLGAFIKSPTYEIVDENGEFDTASKVTGYLYGLRYEEFISPAISVIQEQQKEIDSQTIRLNELENRILKLEIA